MPTRQPREPCRSAGDGRGANAEIHSLFPALCRGHASHVMRHGAGSEGGRRRALRLGGNAIARAGRVRQPPAAPRAHRDRSLSAQSGGARPRQGSCCRLPAARRCRCCRSCGAGHIRSSPRFPRSYSAQQPANSGEVSACLPASAAIASAPARKQPPPSSRAASAPSRTPAGAAATTPAATAPRAARVEAPTAASRSAQGQTVAAPARGTVGAAAVAAPAGTGTSSPARKA